MTQYDYSNLKRTIANQDYVGTIKNLTELYIKDQNKFLNRILINGCLPEPLSRKFKNETIDFFQLCCSTAKKKLQEINEEIAKKFYMDISKLIVTIKNIKKLNDSNTSRLVSNDFFENPFVKQVRILMTFIECQYYYSDIEVSQLLEGKNLLNGLEREISNNEEHISNADTLESTVEVVEIITKFAYYKFDMLKEKQSYKNYNDVSPYGLPNVEELMHLGAHRLSLEEAWERYKFDELDFQIYNNQGEKFHYYKAPNQDRYMKEKAAKFRYQYREFTEIMTQIREEHDKNTSISIPDHTDIEFNKPKDIFDLDDEKFLNYKEYLDISFKIFWDELEEEAGSTIHTIKIGDHKNIKIKEVFLGIEYLMSLALVYREVSYKEFDETNFSNLTPVFTIKEISNHFAKLHNLSTKKSVEIIELFIFRSNPKFDLFSQPLVHLMDDKIVFTPQLVTQMNVPRIVNKYLSYWDIDISEKGKELERNLKEIMKFSSYFDVNTETVEFEAYDGKPVEYDLIALFDKKLILIELKSLKRSFSPKEFRKREKEILYGVKQVNRREDILIKEWNQVKDMLDIEVPFKQIKKEDIVKIVCTNIFEFSGRVEEDVYVTDTSSLTKFFLDPKIEKIGTKSQSTEILGNYKLWENKPTINELVEFLKLPIAIKGILAGLKEVPRGILRIEKDDPKIAFQDFTLDQHFNPHSHIFEEN